MVPIRSCRQISTSSARTLTSITDERANDLDSGNASPPQMSSTSPRIAPNPTADFPEDGYAPLSAAARRAPSAEMRPNKRAAFRDRAAAGGKRRMEQVPDMDHLGPDLEADARHLLKSVRNHLQQCRDAAGGAIPRLQHPARPTRVVG